MNTLLKNVDRGFIFSVHNISTLPSPKALINMSYENVSRWIREIPRQVKTQEACIKAVEEDPSNLRHVPDRFKTEKMCNEAVRNIPAACMERLLSAYVPDHLKT